MPRWARAMLCVVLGLITTLALAWYPYLRHWKPGPPTGATNALTVLRDDGYALANRAERIGDVTLRVRRDSWLKTTYWMNEGVFPLGPIERGRVPRRWQDVLAPAEVEDGRPVVEYQTEMSGWPLRCVRAGHIETRPQAAISLVPRPWGAFELTSRGQTIWVPIAVRRRNFAFNAVVHSLIWACLFFGPGLIRLGIRARRGRCVACGYDLAETPGLCPECGRAPRPARRETIPA